MALITNTWFLKLHRAQNQQRQTLVLAGIHNGLVRNSLLCKDLDSKMTWTAKLLWPIGLLISQLEKAIVIPFGSTVLVMVCCAYPLKLKLKQKLSLYTIVAPQRSRE